MRQKARPTRDRIAELLVNKLSWKERPIKCKFGFHDFGDWHLNLHFVTNAPETRYRTCRACGHKQTQNAKTVYQ